MIFQARTVQEVYKSNEDLGFWGPVVLLMFVAGAVRGESDTLGILANGHPTVADEKDVATWLFFVVAIVCLGPFWAEVKHIGARRKEAGKREFVTPFYFGYFAVWILVSHFLFANFK
jgi:hypothetical protein